MIKSHERRIKPFTVALGFLGWLSSIKVTNRRFSVQNNHFKNRPNPTRWLNENGQIPEDDLPRLSKSRLTMVGISKEDLITSKVQTNKDKLTKIFGLQHHNYEKKNCNHTRSYTALLQVLLVPWKRSTWFTLSKFPADSEQNKWTTPVNGLADQGSLALQPEIRKNHAGELIH